MTNHSKPNRSELDNFEKQVFNALSRLGDQSTQELDFASRHNTHIKFSKQKKSGAKWTVLKNISLNADSYSIETDPGDLGLLSLVVHEIRHLQQGPLTALSVYGELDAWQVGFRFYRKVSSKPLRKPLEELLELPLSWSRQNLLQAKILMKQYSPGYRIDWYPLYPIHHEIIWWLTHHQPGGSET